MKAFKKILLILIFLFACLEYSFSQNQYRYFLKLFNGKDDKKIIQVIEENGTKRIIVYEKEDKQTYDLFKKKMEKEKTEMLSISGRYSSFKEFQKIKGTMDNIITDLEHKARKFLSDGNPSGVEVPKSSNAFIHQKPVVKVIPPKPTEKIFRIKRIHRDK